MIYTDREKLTVIELSEERDMLTFDKLAPVLWERPANMVYVEFSGLLYGIISMGEIDRANAAGKHYVEINKQFTWLRPGEYMRARQIFKDTAAINALPVIDETGHLLGDYTRWDDLILSKNPPAFLNNKFTDAFWEKNSRVALVKPCAIFEQKQRLLLEWHDRLKAQGVSVEIIDRQQVPEYLEISDKIIFTDEDELRCIAALCTDLLNRTFDSAVTAKFLTYKKSSGSFRRKLLTPFYNPFKIRVYTSCCLELRKIKTLTSRNLCIWWMKNLINQA